MAIFGCTETLFKKDDINDSQDEEDEETPSDIWDDTALIEAYDRAVQSFKNGLENQINESQDERKSDKKKKKRHRNRSGSKMETQWHVGDRCQALFGEDGLYYDSVILSVNSRTNRIRVKFDYFNNVETVSSDSIQSRDSGDTASERSEKSEGHLNLQDAPRDGHGHFNHQDGPRDGHGHFNHSNSVQFVDGWRVGDVCYAPADDRGRDYAEAFIVSFPRRGHCLVTFMKSKARRVVDVTSLKPHDKFNEQEQRAFRPSPSQWPGGNNPHPQHPYSFPPSFPFDYPCPPMPPPFMNFLPPPNSHIPKHLQGWMNSPGTNGMSPPPPPPPIPSDINIDNEDALASMLMSWYMVGYHTGYYQAQRGCSGTFIPFKTEKMDTDEKSPSGTKNVTPRDKS